MLEVRCCFTVTKTEVGMAVRENLVHCARHSERRGQLEILVEKVDTTFETVMYLAAAVARTSHYNLLVGKRPSSRE